MNRLEEFLKEKAGAGKVNTPLMEYGKYQEDIEEHYTEFIERGCPYIYKVGAYAEIDGNKFDYAYIYLGMEREKDGRLVYLGKLEFPDGENSDIGNTLGRLMKCLEMIDSIFTLWSD